MLRGMSAPLLQWWLAYYRMDPWGQERADLRMGIICSQLDACHRAKGAVKPPIKFMPYAQQDVTQQPHDEMKATAMKIAKRFGKPNG